MKKQYRKCTHNLTKNLNTRKRCEICLELTVKTPERHWRHPSVFTVNFEHILHLFLVFPLLTLKKILAGVDRDYHLEHYHYTRWGYSTFVWFDDLTWYLSRYSTSFLSDTFSIQNSYRFSIWLLISPRAE